MILGRNPSLIARTLAAAYLAWALQFGAGVAHAADGLDADQRQALTDALANLTASRNAIAMLVSECDGGMMQVFACVAPRGTARGPAGCAPSDRSCNLAIAMRDTEAAIKKLDEALQPPR